MRQHLSASAGRPLLLALLLEAASMRAHAADSVSLSLNGRPLASAEAGISFEPGKSHLLRLTPDWQRLAGGRVGVIVRKFLPDGCAEEPRADVGRGDARDFELGPLAMPPTYAFRFGAIYRRGYRLKTAVEEVTGRPLWKVSLVQGQCAEPAARPAGNPIPAGQAGFVPRDEGADGRAHTTPPPGV